MLGVLYLIAISIGVASGECPDGWTVFGGSCYLFGHDTKTFTEAQHFCEQHRANLVSIETQTEQTFLQTACKYSAQDTFWMGLTDADIEDIWKWTGSGDTSSYTAWQPGQPDDGFNANCAALCSDCGYKWADRSCSDMYYPLCEKSLKICLLYINSQCDTFWIVLKDAGIEDIWIWNESRGTAGYPAWYSGQPNDRFYQNFAILCPECGYQWSDRSCLNPQVAMRRLDRLVA